MVIKSLCSCKKMESTPIDLKDSTCKFNSELFSEYEKYISDEYIFDEYISEEYISDEYVSNEDENEDDENYINEINKINEKFYNNIQNISYSKLASIYNERNNRKTQVLLLLYTIQICILYK